MKRFFTLIFLGMLMINSINAQTASAVIFSENGEKFIAYLNGEQQNDVAKANVKISGLTAEFYQLRVDFEDAKYADFSNGNFAVAAGNETTYVIKLNKKGEYVCRFQGQVPSQGPSTTSSTPTSDVKNYAEADDVENIQMVDEPEPDDKVTMNTNVSGTGVNMGVNQTTTTTTTSKGSTPVKGESINMNVNVDGVDMGISLDVTGMDMEGDMEGEIEFEEVTTTSTTTSKSTTTNTQVEQDQELSKQHVVVAGPCSGSMAPTNFASAKKSIESKGFDEDKLTIAKQIVKSNCMTANQIKEVLAFFGFEETKLAFARYSYDYCVDQNNYYVINDAFSFSSSVDELNKYIESK